MGWHIVITEEMRAMGLSGNDLVVFALINGFSQDGQGCFYGSIAYICETCGIARRTALYIIQDLVDRGFIVKTETIQNGVKSISYQVSANNAQVVQKLHRGGAKNAPNNKVENINNINESMYKETRFNFKKSLLEIGVSEEVADAWLQVRKTKKATNTKIAFDKVHSEILKSGLSPDECIRKSVENSWSGFKADWLQDQRQERKVPPKERRERESVLEHNLKVMDEMFGTNMHQQAYSKKEVYDEQ